LSLQKGALPQEIQKITGHKNIDTLYKYIRSDTQEAINKIREIWE
jgi:hypothetical protein